MKLTNSAVVLWSLYVYAPNKGAPIFFTIAYACSGAGHLWQCYHHKAFRLMGLHPLCALMFALGYALREWGAYNYLYTGTATTLILYILSQVFIYVAPPLLELANYHVLGRMFSYAPSFAPVPAGTARTVFSLLMIVVETVNSLGVALAANVHSTEQSLGRVLTLLALSLQLCICVSFVVLTAWFQRRCRKADAHATISTPLRALTPVLRHEWFFYIFEATLMLINSIIWNIWSPVRYLPNDTSLYLSQDGTELLQAPEVDDSDDRPLIMKIACVLTFGLFFRGKKHYVPRRTTSEYPLTTRQN
ncbi:hypothetical protein M406DRAFT_257698 [Cryphonectria parasitica EP155]|uniref:RTA1 domain protein n=1 Tax=Cryphonectria parasitica (strain ATCC 38755 / EP155) TaxID=660469 RepID=A0A9P4Y2N1_CRYP1|nr:uncharacterized protein M406DRAFT_257698 [Cryphonectria parasitica EP155]KAF3765325.1 hypothetical protein M406DRAFT_257698 [Cryphonectria parasitica EP155]